MFTVIVESSFSATHRLRRADGSIEPQHGHDWIVRAHFSRPALGDTGMVIDFLEAQAALRSAIERLHHGDLNTYEPFTGLNPTAELVARHIFDRLTEGGLTCVRRVEVTEAPGCVAAFEPHGT